MNRDARRLVTIVMVAFTLVVLALLIRAILDGGTTVLSAGALTLHIPAPALFIVLIVGEAVFLIWYRSAKPSH